MAIKGWSESLKMVIHLLLSLMLADIGFGQQEWRVPDVPENVRWKSDENSVTLWWDPPSTISQILVRGYTISYGIGTPNRRVIIEGPNTNAFTVNGLKPNTTYVFALTAYNEADGEDSEKILLTATTTTTTNVAAKITSNENVQSEQLLLAPQNLVLRPISPSEIDVRWMDDNAKTNDDNRVRSYQSLRSYVIRYGAYGDDLRGRLTTKQQSAVIDDLRANTVYEVSVKVTLPNGRESAWSHSETAKTSQLWRSDQQNPSMAIEQCNFEAMDNCIFYSDPIAPLDFVITKADQLVPQRQSGDYYISLHSVLEQRNYGRLISRSLTFSQGLPYCLSAWLYIKSNSEGTFSVGVSRKVGGRDLERSLFVANLAKMAKERWRQLSIDFVAPEGPFQLSFEIRKQKSDQFWIAFDDIEIVNGECTAKLNSISHSNGRLIGSFLQH